MNEQTLQHTLRGIGLKDDVRDRLIYQVMRECASEKIQQGQNKALTGMLPPKRRTRRESFVRFAAVGTAVLMLAVGTMVVWLTLSGGSEELLPPVVTGSPAPVVSPSPETSPIPTESPSPSPSEEDRLLAYFNGDGFFGGEELNIRHMFLASYYDSPEQLDLYWLFYSFGEILSHEEAVALGLNDENCPAFRYSLEMMDAVLSENTGLTLTQTEGVGLERFKSFDEYGNYYDVHSDTNYMAQTQFSSCEIEGELVRLRYVNWFLSGDDGAILTLRKTPEGGYLFVSNQLVNPPAAETLDRKGIAAALIELNWREPPDFTPEISVFPLVNAVENARVSIESPVAFVDEDLQPVTLPFAPENYTIVAHNDSAAMAYGLCLPNGKAEYALMFTDGTIARDADGEYICFRYHSVVSPQGSVIICKEKDGVLQYGLYDLAARRELLPCEYSHLNLIEDSFFYGIKDGEGYLLDPDGTALYAFGVVLENNNYWAVWNEYRLDAEHRLFYSVACYEEARYGLLSRFGDYLVFSVPGAPYDVLVITDREGNELRQKGGNICDDDDEDTFLFARSDGFVLLDKDLNERFFPVELEWSAVNCYFDGTEIHYEYGDGSAYPYYAVNEAGDVRKLAYEPRAELLYFDPLQSTYTLFSRNGAIQREFPEGSYAITSGDFAMEYITDENGASVPKAVYELAKGNYLANDIYGVVHEAPGPDGGLFIYLDADTCVLQFPDGSRVPVPSAPKVERNET